MPQRLQSSPTSIPKRAAVLFGAAFAFVFLTSYDPDALPPGMLGASQWLVLLPAALVLAMRRRSRPVVAALCLAAGVFAGTCLAAMLHSSNIWPIAGVYWTAVWTPPIVIGSVAGALVVRHGERPAGGGGRR